MAVHPESGTDRTPSLLRQPKSVWAVAFACVVSFMGIGLVDPILPTMATELHASPAQVSLLFTSYLLVTAVAMLITGWVSSRIGAKKTLIAGLVIIVVFSAAAGMANGVGGIIGFRAGWGLGNALFIATSLAVIVGAASGGFQGAIMLYEAALGLGIAAGPLVGGLLGGISWRGPFFGVAALMAIALVSVIALLAPTPRPAERAPISAPIKALRHRGLLTVSITALLYNWGFFTVMGYAPYPMKIGVHQLGLVFFGWGVLVAIFAVFVAPWAQRAIGTARSLYITLFLMTLDLAAIAYWVDRPTVIIICVIVSGAFIGMNNTLVTGTVMLVAPVPRPTASAAYSFVRFIGGGLAPWVAGILAARYGDHLPFYIGAAAIFAAILVLATAHRLVAAAGTGSSSGQQPQPERAAGEIVEAGKDVVHGHLHRADGEPVAQAVLTLIDQSGRQVARGISSHDGYYRIAGRGAGGHVLIVSAAGYQPEACPVVLNGAPTELSVTLGGSGSLRGTVAAASTGLPVASATVTLIDSRGEVIAGRQTDPAGGFGFDEIGSGDYAMAVHAPGSRPAVRVVSVPESGTATAAIELLAHTPVRGVARSSRDGRPVREVMLTLVDPDGHTVDTAFTGRDGSYCFPSVPEGDYTLIASGYPPVTTTVAITDTSATTTRDVTLGYQGDC